MTEILTQKEYNAKYYKENKEEILKKLMEQKECPFCCRTVSAQRLKAHQNTQLCKSHRNDKKDEIKELKQMIEQLSLKINS